MCSLSRLACFAVEESDLFWKQTWPGRFQRIFSLVISWNCPNPFWWRKTRERICWVRKVRVRYVDPNLKNQLTERHCSVVPNRRGWPWHGIIWWAMSLVRYCDSCCLTLFLDMQIPYRAQKSVSMRNANARMAVLQNLQKRSSQRPDAPQAGQRTLFDSFSRQAAMETWPTRRWSMLENTKFSCLISVKPSSVQEPRLF